MLLTTLLPPLTPCYVAMCTSEAIVDMQIVQGPRYPDHFYTTSTGPNRYISHNFRLVAFGKRSYEERRRYDIASGSIAIKDFHDNLIGSISFHFVQAHCLA